MGPMTHRKYFCFRIGTVSGHSANGGNQSKLFEGPGEGKGAGVTPGTR
jgi:hypothetical protein